MCLKNFIWRGAMWNIFEGKLGENVW
jgi:hypothetical protein